MKVKDVIKRLRKMPQDLDVLFIADDASTTLVPHDEQVEATCVPGERIVRVYLQDDEG